jgi:hypothetical protein
MTDRMHVDDFSLFGGKHCETSCLRKVLAHHNLPLSEEMLLGLGGGVGFIYWHVRNMPSPFMGMRNGRVAEILVKACARMGARAAIWETSSPQRGYERLKGMLAKGEPAIVYGDLAYLPYFGMPEEMHFGGHAFVVFGIDEGVNKAYISDRCMNSVTVSIKELEKARNSTHPPFPPKNRLLKVEHPPKMDNLEKGIREGIKDCCSNMLNPPIKNIGLSGMEKWADTVPKWIKQFKGMNLLGCLFNTFLYIEIGGTGGGGFRAMYANFLREAGTILNNPALGEIATDFDESGRILGEIAVAALPDGWPTLKKIRKLLLKKDCIFMGQKRGARQKTVSLNAELVNLEKRAAEELDSGDTRSLLSCMQKKILEWHEAETKAFKILSGIVR